MALLHRVAHHRIGRLQIEDVILVDARWNQQQRPLVYSFGPRLVLDQLEQVVFEHYRAFGGGDVLPHFEG